jgi:hypothetical protein
VPGGTWGHAKPVPVVSSTGLLPPLAGLSIPFLYIRYFLLASVSAETDSHAPQPSVCSNCSLPTHTLFRLLPVRSPLLGKSLLISSPRGTEMFQFPRSPRIHYVFMYTCRHFRRGGLPHSGTPGSSPACRSPGHFAACRALLRLLAPRHPPYALSFLTSFHCAIFKVQIKVLHNQTVRIGFLPFVQAPLRLRPRDIFLPRKEVIQPHLPIRLPCYDFTPITGPTFDGCAHCWFAHRLRVLQAFVV